MDEQSPFSWERLVWLAFGALGTVVVSVITALAKGRQSVRADANTEWKAVADRLFARVEQLETSNAKCHQDHADSLVREARLTERLARLESKS